MISKKEVQHIAKLARLNLKEKEMRKIKKELSLILKYIEKLKEVNVSNIEPMSHPIFLKNVMRKDELITEDRKEINLLKLAPETKDGYLKVKKII